jgi:hypothetical protein
MLSTDQRRFRKGDKVICWNKPAVIGEQYREYGNTTWLEFPDGTKDTIITHFADGQLNEHIYLASQSERRIADIFGAYFKLLRSELEDLRTSLSVLTLNQ